MQFIARGGRKAESRCTYPLLAITWYAKRAGVVFEARWAGLQGWGSHCLVLGFRGCHHRRACSWQHPASDLAHVWVFVRGFDNDGGGGEERMVHEPTFVC